MIGSAMDMMAQISVNTSSSSASTSTSSDSSSSGEFSKLMEKHQSEANSDTSTNANQSSESGSATEETVEQSTPGDEVTEVQMEMMAALCMNTLNIRTVDVELDTEELELDLNLLVSVEEEVVEIAEITLDEEMIIDLPEFVDVSADVDLASSGKFEEAAIVLDEEIVVADMDETVEVTLEMPELDVEQSVETEAEVAVEVETAAVEENGPEVEVERNVKTESTVVEKEESKTEDEVLVSEHGQGTVVFEKVEATPVKVAETVNTQDPDMDVQIAEIIQEADENGEKSVTIRLTPEGLGTVTAQITHTAEGNLQIILQTVDDAAANLLKSHINQLAMALQTNNQTVTIEVHSTEEAEATEQDLQQEMEQENQPQEEQQKQEEQVFTYSEDFMQQLRLGLVKEFSLEISE